jgi:hypothetical protein
MIQEYIAEQEGEPIHDDSQFVIDEDTKEATAFQAVVVHFRQ